MAASLGPLILARLSSKTKDQVIFLIGRREKARDLSTCFPSWTLSHITYHTRASFLPFKGHQNLDPDLRNLNLKRVIWIYYPVHVQCTGLYWPEGGVGGGRGVGLCYIFGVFGGKINLTKDMLLQWAPLLMSEMTCRTPKQCPGKTFRWPQKRNCIYCLIFKALFNQRLLYDVINNMYTINFEKFT
jgi:hypothetical protein